MDDERFEMVGRMMIALEVIEGCPEFAALVPEVRTNLVYARAGARTREDVLAIDGRITVIGSMPRAAGRIRFGASSHMARLIIELRRHDPSIRAGIDFASTPDLAAWLERYCAAKGWTFSVIDRGGEPEEIRDAEGASMPWKVAEAVRAAGGKAPKIFYETGAVGKEPVSVLVGREPVEVADQVCAIAREYRAPR
jgi:predicted fused transcriptional regulator/phosphomethylpyrimidine kinase